MEKKKDPNRAFTQKVKIIDDVRLNVPEVKIMLPEVQVNIDQKKEDMLKVSIERESFLKNPHFWIAIFTLATLIISIYALRLTQNDIKLQDERWDSLNIARISISDVNFFTTRRVTIDDFEANDWGYAPSAIQGPTQANSSNELPIKNSVVAKNTVTKDYISDIPAIKVGELKKQLFNRGFDTTKYIYEKQYKPVVTIENVGLLPCTIDSIIVRNFTLDKNYGAVPDQYKIVKDSHFNYSLESREKTSTARISFNTPLNAPLPDFQFEYEVYYTPNLYKRQLMRKVLIKCEKSNFSLINL